MAKDRQAASGKVEEALEAREVLGAALRRAGIQLPALDFRPVGGGVDVYGLVSLGECSAPVARELASVIAKGAGR
ncbi:hypothetical protein [Streptomyces marispadix]|uniref:Uncharacterized protein n=1 Tax=Streptomyces marispadix TaxID=2922868 RepID=A0ABS9SX49_9ACTN|nr:hypothetical protein [Streptomyces marispadix]MCH6160850.1 hypothetical protein [Streptomyces marispadix]